MITNQKKTQIQSRQKLAKKVLTSYLIFCTLLKTSGIRRNFHFELSILPAPVYSVAAWKPQNGVSAEWRANMQPFKKRERPTPSQRPASPVDPLSFVLVSLSRLIRSRKSSQMWSEAGTPTTRSRCHWCEKATVTRSQV
jgi:hypothetical protein